MLGRQGALYELAFASAPLEVLERLGHMPLPPYISRPDAQADRERYQTVYAQTPGAVAAPTAGLHFDEVLMAQLKERGIETAFVTLHVGAGTFSPCGWTIFTTTRCTANGCNWSEAVCAQVRATKARQPCHRRRYNLRTLFKTASRNGAIEPFEGDTSIFIYPGVRFNTVDALITNFHLSESTLLMLVCAFAGYRRTRDAYKVAVEERYRFSVMATPCL